jgi:hypothetical protein
MHNNILYYDAILCWSTYTGRLGLNFTEDGGLTIHKCCTSKVRDGILDFGGACLEGKQSVSKVEHTLQEECSQLSLIRAVVSFRVFDFSLGFGLARFGKVCKNLPHQRVVREVVKTLEIAIVWVVHGGSSSPGSPGLLGSPSRSPPEGPSSNTSVRKALPLPLLLLAIL